MTLAQYLRAGASQPFVWGETDCCAWVSGWVREATGLDPVGPYRSRYQTEIGATRLIKRGGGFVSWISACIEATGLRQTDVPMAGDIGVVQDVNGGRAVAICAGPVWVAKGPRGLIGGKATPIMAWSVPCLS
jgi:hypothetical protein